MSDLKVFQGAKALLGQAPLRTVVCSCTCGFAAERHVTHRSAASSQSTLQSSPARVWGAKVPQNECGMRSFAVEYCFKSYEKAWTGYGLV